MKLSDHFTLQEFISSPTAIRLGIDNKPTPIEIAAMQSLCDNILEPIRIHFNLPIKILSGFRNLELNKAVGGAPTSQHTMGEAADIAIPGIKNVDIWHWVVDNLNFDQVIAEKLKEDDGDAGWVHISHKRVGTQRKEPLSFLGSKYVPGLVYII